MNMKTRKKRRSPVSSKTSNDSSTLEKYFPFFLFGTLFVAFLLRGAAFLSLKESLYFDFLLWDERVYHTWAQKIADGTFKSSSVYEMAPLPAYFIAGIYKVFTPDPVYIRLINIVFGVLTCYLVYLIGHEIGNRRTGLYACILAAVYEPLILYSIVPLKTSLSVFLFGATVYFLVTVLGRPSIVKALLLGIAIGLVQNVRPNCIVLIPLLPMLIVWGYFKNRFSVKSVVFALSMYGLGLLLTSAPFMIRNYQVAGETGAVVSQSGFNLYMCNNLDYKYPLPFATTSPFKQGVQFTIEASRRTGKKLSPSEASSYWRGEVIKTLREQPVALVKKTMRKVQGFLNHDEKGDHYHLAFLSQFVHFFKIPFPGLWLILPLGLSTLIVKSLSCRKTMSMAAVFFMYAATLILFFSNMRVRVPLVTILIPMSAVGIGEIIALIRKKNFRGMALYLTLFAGFMIIGILPAPGKGDMTGFLNTHAIVLNQSGYGDEAIGYWKQSSESRGHYAAFANLSLAGNYLHRGDEKKALHYLEKISEDSFAAAQKYSMLGDIMLRRNEVRMSVSAYEKSLEINSGQRRVRRKLVDLFKKIDKKRARMELRKLRYVDSFYNLY